jgi:large subunit ribosomal protein L33
LVRPTRRSLAQKACYNGRFDLAGRLSGGIAASRNSTPRRGCPGSRRGQARLRTIVPSGAHGTILFWPREVFMAKGKKKAETVFLVCEETGDYNYSLRRKPGGEKLQLKKYCPRLRKRTLHVEKKK